MEKSNVKNDEKYLHSSYKLRNVLYENTDENGNIEMIIVLDNDAIWIYPDNVFKIIRSEILKENNEIINSKTKEKEEILSTVINSDKMVSEDFALKLLSISLNKEKYTDLK